MAGKMKSKMGYKGGKGTMKSKMSTKGGMRGGKKVPSMRMSATTRRGSPRSLVRSGPKKMKRNMKSLLGRMSTMGAGRRPKMTELGVESNKEYLKRNFGMGGTTRTTQDLPQESKYGVGKKVSMRSKMSTKGGMKGGRRTMKSKGYAKGGKS